jgi:biopolymer transport protein ExbB
MSSTNAPFGMRPSFHPTGLDRAVALANGISEALINTALGISGSTIAIIMYNYFTTQIDSLTYKIDESGFSLVQSFATQSQSK